MKSMPVFFIDNKDLLVKGSELVGNIVISHLEQRDKFLTAVPIGQASVNDFDGLIVVRGGNRCIIIDVFESKTKDDWNDIKTILTKTKPKDWPDWIHQYRIDVHGLIQFVALYHNKVAGENEVNIYHLMDLLAETNSKEADLIRNALLLYLKNPKDGEAFKTAERLLTSWNE